MDASVITLASNTLTGSFRTESRFGMISALEVEVFLLQYLILIIGSHLDVLEYCCLLLLKLLSSRRE